MSNSDDFVIKSRCLTKYEGPGGNVIVPAGVQSIAKRVFSGCKKPTRVQLPESMKRLEYGFEGCEAF